MDGEASQEKAKKPCAARSLAVAKAVPTTRLSHVRNLAHAIGRGTPTILGGSLARFARRIFPKSAERFGGGPRQRGR